MGRKARRPAGDPGAQGDIRQPLRPGNIVRGQFCRRKVIWDEIIARTARGKSELKAIAEFELLRAPLSRSRGRTAAAHLPVAVQ